MRWKSVGDHIGGQLLFPAGAEVPVHPHRHGFARCFLASTHPLSI